MQAIQAAGLMQSCFFSEHQRMVGLGGGAGFAATAAQAAMMFS